MENDLQQKLIRPEPTMVEENPPRIFNFRTEAVVHQIRTHIGFVGSSCKRLAVSDQIEIESTRNVLDEQVATGARIGGVRFRVDGPAGGGRFEEQSVRVVGGEDGRV